MKFKWGVFLVSAVFSSISFSKSNVCTSSPGFYTCKNGKIENIQGFYGNVELENVEVTHGIRGIFGTLEINKSIVNHISGNIGDFTAFKSNFL